MANPGKYQAKEVLNKVLNTEEDALKVDIDNVTLNTEGGDVSVEVDLDNSTDDVLVYGNDGSANRKLTTDSSGHLQVDVLTTPTVTISDGGGTISIDDGGGNISIDDGGGNISIDDGGNSITVDGTVTIQDGSGSITVDGDVTANVPFLTGSGSFGGTSTTYADVSGASLHTQRQGLFSYIIQCAATSSTSVVCKVQVSNDNSTWIDAETPEVTVAINSVGQISGTSFFQYTKIQAKAGSAANAQANIYGYAK
tara:strand:+ start:70 stop:828 length:759 start_codon:yes stop_codon:yes gene_type:complete